MTVDPTPDHKALLAACLARPAPFPADRFDGRGIVICAGGVRMFTCAWVLLWMLRNELGCRLPIQLWHLGAAELSPAMRLLLTEFDVELVDAEAVGARNPARIADGWQLKPFAAMHSRFAEVLLLDADQVPIADPAPLFDWPEFRETGAVFWPDIVDLRADNPIWEACGLPAERTISFESGQLLIDKTRHWRALMATLHLNEEAEHYYRLVYGDKDTFLIGWKLTASRYSLVPHRPFPLMRALIQRDFAGEPILQHRIGAKWLLAASQFRIEGFRHEEACLAALEVLKGRWNGRMFWPPAQSPAALAVEARLIESRAFRWHIVGDRDRTIELLPGHQIGAGRDILCQTWCVTEEAGEPVLTIFDDQRPTHRFAPAGDGRWQGRQLLLDGAEATLRPAADADAALDGLSPSSTAVDGLARPAAALDGLARPAAPGGMLESLLLAAGYGAGAAPFDEAMLADALPLLLAAYPDLAAQLEREAARFPERSRERASLRRLAADAARSAPRRLADPAGRQQWRILSTHYQPGD